MTFKRTNDLNPDQLSQNTRYRFKEIEISRLLHILERTTKENPVDLAISMLQTNMPKDWKYTLRLALESYAFQNPNHNEVVQYFRYKNIGVHKIRKFTGVSPNTLIKGGKHDCTPELKPVFPYWDQFQSVLVSWDFIKPYYNLFDEKLIHEMEYKTHNEYTQAQPCQEQPEEDYSHLGPAPTTREIEESPIERMRRAEAEFHANYLTPTPEPEPTKEPEKPKLKSWEDFEDEEPDMEAGRRAAYGDEEYERMLADGYFD